MMQEFLTWGALVTAGGSLAAIFTFWMNRGRAEARAEIAVTVAQTASAKAELVSAQLAETRITFARDYASHADLVASESRYATSIDGLRTELRGINERLDRIIEGYMKK